MTWESQYNENLKRTQENKCMNMMELFESTMELFVSTFHLDHNKLKWDGRYTDDNCVHYNYLDECFCLIEEKIYGLKN